jgi:transposase InsO family protein
MAKKLSSIPSLHAFNYDTTTWSSYRDRMGFYFHANGIVTDAERKSLFLWSVGDHVYSLLESLVAPRLLTEAELTYVNLIEILDKHYDDTKNIMTATYNFFSCYQKSGQSFTEWKAELYDKVRRCGFTTSTLATKPIDRAIRDMYVIGIRNPKIRQALLKEQDPDLQAAEKLILAAERLEQDVRHFAHPLKDNNSSVDKIHDQQFKSNKQKQTYSNKNRDYKSNNHNDKRRDYKLNNLDKDRTYNPCETCGSTKHLRSNCKFRDYTCNYCKKNGHLEKVCRQKKNEQLSTKHITTVSKLNSSNLSISPIRSLDFSCMISLEVNGNPITFEIDTGSSHTIISMLDWHRLQSPTLSSSTLRLKCYSGKSLAISGECVVPVKYNNHTYNLQLIVVQDAHPPLLGLQWIRFLHLDLNHLIRDAQPDNYHIHQVVFASKLQTILQKYNHVLNNKLGHCTKMKAHIELKPNATPKFFKPRPIPFAYIDGVKEEITRKVAAGILERVDTSLWAAPIVPVKKPNGKIRICGDFKVTINPHTLVDQHPIPSIEELFSRLRNGQQFTKLDLSDAYLQVELDDSSKNLVVINTPLGLYKYNRMPFGISSAPAIFQRLIDQVILDIPNCIAYLDDLLITGSTEDEHLKTLDEVLHKLADYGFTCNPDKCLFFQDSVSYLGFRIDKTGKIPDPARVEAIKRMPPPKNVKELEAFIGKINYYGQFISNFSSKCKILNQLRKKNARWNWTNDCQTAFNYLLEEISTATTLVHFDDKLPIILATDASHYGIGAVIMHKYSDGSEKPLAFASKTLTDVEIKYSQIEKEGLSIIFGVKKFHKYLAGRSFELITDHRPLLSIFNPAKGIPTTTANRLQRWAIFLMGYNYVIHFKPTEHHANADALSRLPIQDDKTFIDSDSLHVNFIHHEHSEKWPLTPLVIAKATSTDSILKRVKQFIQSSWPSSFSKKQNPELIPYFINRYSLSIMNDCIMKGDQVVIPSTLQTQVLRLLHKDHLGIVKMKQIARNYCWWSTINRDIKQVTQSCNLCRKFQSLPKPQYHSWEEPKQVWSRIHVDFAGPIWNSKWLIIIDAKSKYPFVIDMHNNTTATNLIQALEQVFDFLGPPETLISDNGPPFTSFQMSKFYEKYGISHITTAPYHPASNGLAERFVRSFKEAMLKQQHLGYLNKSIALRNVLRSYRWSPHTSTDSSPANLLFRHSIRTEFDIMKPTSSSTTTSLQEPKFVVGQLVWTLKYQHNHRPQWENAFIIKPIGSMLYELRLSNGQVCKRHQNQLRPYYSSQSAPSTSYSLSSDLALPKSSTTTTHSPFPSTPRYPQRNRRPPVRYQPS